jgi:hypothetical protein
LASGGENSLQQDSDCDSIAIIGRMIMDLDAQRREVDRNYDRFQRLLASILPEHEGEIALMRDGEIVGYFKHVRDAIGAANMQFSDGIYSLQEVKKEPIDLGIFSHAGG